MGALLYRASRDGWNSQSHFHPRCDDKGATLTVIRDTKGHIFGGYTEHSWRHMGGSYRPDPKAWLFWVKCHAGLPPNKTPVTTVTHAVFCRNTCGPIFGGGNDVFLASDMHQCRINWGHSYKLPAGLSNNVITGKAGQHFLVNEVEVYQVV